MEPYLLCSVLGIPLYPNVGIGSVAHCREESKLNEGGMPASLPKKELITSWDGEGDIFVEPIDTYELVPQDHCQLPVLDCR